MSLEIDWNKLQDFKNHYRGLASYQNHKLVKIRTLLKVVALKVPRNYISDEDLDTLMDLAKAELYKLPSEESMTIDLMTEDR